MIKVTAEISRSDLVYGRDNGLLIPKPADSACRKFHQTQRRTSGLFLSASSTRPHWIVGSRIRKAQVRVMHSEQTEYCTNDGPNAGRKELFPQLFSDRNPHPTVKSADRPSCNGNPGTDRDQVHYFIDQRPVPVRFRKDRAKGTRPASVHFQLRTQRS